VNPQPYTLRNDLINIELNDHGDASSITSPLLTGKYFERFEKNKGCGISWSFSTEDTHDLPHEWHPVLILPTDQSLYIEGEAQQIQVSLKVELEGSLVSWVIQLKNLSKKKLDCVTFDIDFLYDKNSDSAFTFPYGSGWSLPISELKHGDEFSMHDPVKASMQWISLYNNYCGFYIGIHDPEPLYKTLCISRREGKIALIWQFPDLSISQHETIDLPPIYMGIHENGWRGGAEIYQQWTEKTLQEPNVPQWYAKNPTWAWVGLREQHAGKYLHVLADLQHVSDQVARGGVQLLQLTGYNQKGHDTQFPDYIPGENFGGADGLVKQLDTIHKKSRRMSIYVNGRIVDPDSSVTPEQRGAWAVRSEPDGKPQQETYGKVTFDVMCPGSTGWRNLFKKRVEYLVETFLVDGIYIDQVCAATSHPCYAGGHDHNKPNKAWKDYKFFIEDMSKLLLTLNPELFLATEGVCDVFGQYFDSQQAHNDWYPGLNGKGKPLYDLYRYTFPKHILLVGTVTDDPNTWFYIKLAHILGCGIDFGVRDWDIFPADFLQKAEWIQFWYAKHFKILQHIGLSPVKSNLENIRANIFQTENTWIVNGAWIPDRKKKQTCNECELCIDNLTGREVSHINIQSFDEKTTCTWNVENDRIEIKFPFTEIFGIEISMKSTQGD
jgi:hypothetical protein